MRIAEDLDRARVQAEVNYLHNRAIADGRKDMTADEVLVFKAHDSDPARAGRVPHTAFTDPTCPPGAPTRASVEMRGLAVFT